ncbi:carbohydrate ABC transporter permease [Kitasatospora sp. NPDC002227]|uniref:carbohydrate ABC transporter permease n=1 Tax=Kitasatospora sp. NPDC002227 TaxID=3154773 RepID=UPI0033238BF5
MAADLLLILWIALTSLRGSSDILHQAFGLPAPPRVGNYLTALRDGGFGQAALNSVLVAVVSSLAAVAIAAPCAYALSRRRSRVSSMLTMTFAMGLGVPGQVLVVPLFVGLAKVNLTDSHLGLILVYIGLAMPFTVFMLTGFFAGIPSVLEEAAVLDGAGPVRTFVQVVLPVARGGLITAFLLQFISGWNETLFALVLTHSQDQITLPVALAEFVATEQINGMDYGTMFAGVCIILAPMIALFSWMGTRIIQGMTVGIGK